MNFERPKFAVTVALLNIRVKRYVILALEKFVENETI